MQLSIRGDPTIGMLRLSPLTNSSRWQCYHHDDQSIIPGSRHVAAVGLHQDGWHPQHVGNIALFLMAIFRTLAQLCNPGTAIIAMMLSTALKWFTIALIMVLTPHCHARAAKLLSWCSHHSHACTSRIILVAAQRFTIRPNWQCYHTCRF